MPVESKPPVKPVVLIRPYKGLLPVGYKILEYATDSLKCVEYVDEKRTISAYYYEKLRSGARVGIISEAPKSPE